MAQKLNPLDPFLRGSGPGVVLLDGGFGTGLGDSPQKHALWGAQLIFSEEGREAISNVHRGFLEAGADIICSSSYVMSFEGFKMAGSFENLPGAPLSDEQQEHFSKKCLRASVELAQKERDLFWKGKKAGNGRLRPLVAASVGPAGDNLCIWAGATDPNTSGSRLALEDDVVSSYYVRKIGALSCSNPDIIAIETLPTLAEARLALAAAASVSPDLRLWISFICCDESRTTGGDLVSEAVSALIAADRTHRQIVAFGVNCTSFGLLQPLLREIREANPDTTLIAYPNSGEVWDAAKESRCWHGDATDLDGSHALKLREWGASVIGGCCRVTKGQISKFREALYS